MARSASPIVAENAPTGWRRGARRPPSRREASQAMAGFADDVLDQARDQTAHQLVLDAVGILIALPAANFAQDDRAKRRFRHVATGKEFGSQAVVDVVRVIGDVVRDGRDLRFGARVAPELEILKRLP